MVFAQNEGNIGITLGVIALAVFGITKAAKFFGKAYQKFDTDGAVHQTAKAAVTERIKRFFGR